MPLHLAKGINLAIALLAPVLATLFFHWRTRMTARRLQHSSHQPR
jgi:hypothetical protein